MPFLSGVKVKTPTFNDAELSFTQKKGHLSSMETLNFSVSQVLSREITSDQKSKCCELLETKTLIDSKASNGGGTEVPLQTICDLQWS